MPREWPSLRVKTISPRSSMGVWVGPSVLVFTRTPHGKRCLVSMREGIVDTKATVIMMGMTDCAGCRTTGVIHTAITYKTELKR
jgi:hypothetical protein